MGVTKKPLRKRATLLLFVAFGIVLGPFVLPASAATYVFPVIGDASFSNDFSAPRSDGPHHAIDIIADKGQPIVSATDGTITLVSYPEPSWGFAVFIRSTSGYTYRYIHMNNDTPGTDDGRGGAMNAYAPDMKPGNRVVRGQRLGKVGDSGNAESTVAHLHFEVTNPDGDPVNPYDGLRQAQHLPTPVSYPPLAGEILPYGSRYRGGVQVAMGNFDGDAQRETVTGPGNGGGPRVVVFDHTNQQTAHNFYAFDSSLRGGVDVAAGDVNGDGKDEVIAGLGPRYSPRVAVFEIGTGSTRTKLIEFMAFNSTLRSGIRVSAGDVNGDGDDEIIASTGPGTAPRVNIFEADGTLLKSLVPYSSSSRAGVDVAAADVVGTTADEIIVAPGAGASPQVKTFDYATLNQLGAFNAYDQSFTGGVRVSAGNIKTATSKAEILTAPHTNGSPRIRLFTYQGSVIESDYFIEQWWRGAAYDVGASLGTSKAGLGGNRRTSIRMGITN